MQSLEYLNDRELQQGLYSYGLEPEFLMKLTRSQALDALHMLTKHLTPCNNEQIRNMLNKRSRRCVKKKGRVGQQLLNRTPFESSSAPCDDTGKIRNPLTNRCVNESGKLGQSIVRGMSGQELKDIPASILFEEAKAELDEKQAEKIILDAIVEKQKEEAAQQIMLNAIAKKQEEEAAVQQTIDDIEEADQVLQADQAEEADQVLQADQALEAKEVEVKEQPSIISRIGTFLFGGAKSEDEGVEEFEGEESDDSSATVKLEPKQMQARVCTNLPAGACLANKNCRLQDGMCVKGQLTPLQNALFAFENNPTMKNANDYYVHYLSSNAPMSALKSTLSGEASKRVMTEYLKKAIQFAFQYIHDAPSLHSAGTFYHIADAHYSGKIIATEAALRSDHAKRHLNEFIRYSLGRSDRSYFNHNNPRHSKRRFTFDA